VGQGQGRGLRGRCPRGRRVPARGLSQHVCKTRNLTKSFAKALPQAVIFLCLQRPADLPSRPLLRLTPVGGCAPVGADMLQCLPRAGS